MSTYILGTTQRGTRPRTECRGAHIDKFFSSPGTWAVPVAADRRSELRAAPVWADDDVADLPVVDAALTTVGGGLASLALVHTLRVAGVAARDLRVVSPTADPADSFRQLAQAAQLGERERLRSDSAARMDSMWGFPGYAVEEAAVRRSARPLWRVLAEPVAAEVFTPVSGHVYAGITVEADRLGWGTMLMPGRVTVIRPRREGGFFTLVDDDGHCCSVIRSRYVHLGLGYAGLRLTEELTRYRAQHGDGFSCVNAYEPHDHVYRTLARTGGTVVVQGAGITASRVLDRLVEVRDRSGRDIHVVHLVRRPGRRGADPTKVWDHQPFNFPKAALGGQLATRVAGLADEQDRGALITALAPTTTARRRHWQEQLRRGRADGFYRVLIGTVTEIAPAADGGIVVRVADAQTPELQCALPAAFLIDCTGLTPRIADHPLVDDLLRARLGRANSHGRLAVDENFEVREARNGPARMYATGAITFGSRVGPVDSFWGLQAGALRVCDELARLGFCDRIGMRRSVTGWWRWLRGRAP
jgi:hypothetical protein